MLVLCMCVCVCVCVLCVISNVYVSVVCGCVITQCLMCY
jgi:hypothetical protein